MKHRSTHIFILVAALLVAAPRASQELSAMKDTLNHRLRSEIFNAFLSFHAGDPTRPAPPTLAGLFACDSPRADAPARPAATQVEVHARREVPAEAQTEVEEVPSEVAAITEPVVEIAALEPAAAALAEAANYKFELHDTKVIRGRELAMIIPPDADVTVAPPPPPSRRESARRATALRRRAAEFERVTATFKVDFEKAVVLRGLAPEELRRQFPQVETLRLENEGARVWTKALKLRGATPKPAPAAPPVPASRAACPKSAPSAEAAPAPLIGCGPSAVETFYAGE